MAKLEWGFIGFGEAGSAFASHISKHLKRPIFVSDPLLNSHPIPGTVRERLDIAHAEVLRDVASLAAKCDLVVSLVTPRVASAVAGQAAKAWKRGLFIDFNSVSPSEKRAMADLFPQGTYVDGAILGSVAQEGAASPLAVAGPRASRASASLRRVGLTVSVAGPQVGAASALKMCRSIFMKGLECLFVETLMAAGEFDLAQSVLKSIEQTFQFYGFRRLVQMLVTTHAVHCSRRSDEMQSATTMMHEMGMPGHMTKAARDFLTDSARAGLPDHFRTSEPDEFGAVIGYLRNTYGKKQ
jgi:3-hydroxyisobutyrate dehydrogenase-like beta-hydroxyacid dehydrogenase